MPASRSRRSPPARERDQHVVAGEREAEKAPRRLVAAHHADRIQLVEDRALGVEIGDRPRAIGRAGPSAPFDAGVRGAERGAAQQGDDDRGRADGEQWLAARSASAAITISSDSAMTT